MPRILRLMLGFAIVSSLTFLGADLARAHRLANGLDRPLLPLLAEPIRLALRYVSPLTSRPLNILVVGTDRIYGPDGQVLSGAPGHADTLMMVRIRPGAGRIDLVAIPRDTLVNITGYGPHKIAAAHFFGELPLLRRTVEDLLGIPIHRTMRLDLSGLQHFIDDLGGLELTVDRGLHYDDHTAGLHIHLSPGRQRLDGRKALEYLRFRHDPLGDIGRIRRQQAFVKAMITQMLNPATLWKLPALVKAFQESAESDLAAEELWQLGAWCCLGHQKSLQLAMVPGRFGWYDRFSVWQVDRPALERLRQRIGA